LTDRAARSLKPLAYIAAVVIGAALGWFLPLWLSITVAFVGLLGVLARFLYVRSRGATSTRG
jgi:hypothetical protein